LQISLCIDGICDSIAISILIRYPTSTDATTNVAQSSIIANVSRIVSLTFFFILLALCHSDLIVPTLNVGIEVVLKLPLLELAVRLVDLDDLVKRPGSVVHATDHAAHVIHSDLMLIEIFNLLAKMLDALRVPRDVDVAVEMVSVVMVHIHEERHRRVVQNNIARLPISSRILDYFLVAPSFNVAVLLQLIQNLSLVMVALDYELLPGQLLQDTFPFEILVGPDHISKQIDHIVWSNGLVPKFYHIVFHVLSVVPRTVVIPKYVRVPPMEI